MNYFNKKAILCCISILCLSCTQIDNYFLGKDNTPRPNALPPLHSTVKIVDKWSIPVGNKPKKININLKLRPEIIGNRLYVASASGEVQAIDRFTGKTVWSKHYSQGFISGPTVASGVIALGTDSSRVFLLKQQDGSLVWQKKISGEMLAKPVIVDNTVLAKTIDGNLYAFDKLSGVKRWSVSHGATNLMLKASASPVIVNSKLALVGYSDGKMDAIDIRSGHLVWQRSIAYAQGASDIESLVDIDTDPIVQEDIVYLGTYQGYVGALSLKTNNFLWQKPASTYRDMILSEGMLYFVDNQDIIWAVNAKNGKVLWKQPVLKGRGITSPALSDRYLILADKTGLVHILSKRTGKLIFRRQFKGAIHVAPLVMNQSIYILTANGRLCRFLIG